MSSNYAVSWQLPEIHLSESASTVAFIFWCEDYDPSFQIKHPAFLLYIEEEDPQIIVSIHASLLLRMKVTWAFRFCRVCVVCSSFEFPLSTPKIVVSQGDEFRGVPDSENCPSLRYLSGLLRKLPTEVCSSLWVVCLSVAFRPYVDLCSIRNLIPTA